MANAAAVFPDAVGPARQIYGGNAAVKVDGVWYTALKIRWLLHCKTCFEGVSPAYV